MSMRKFNVMSILWFLTNLSAPWMQLQLIFMQHANMRMKCSNREENDLEHSLSTLKVKSVNRVWVRLLQHFPHNPRFNCLAAWPAGFQRLSHIQKVTDASAIEYFSCSSVLEQDSQALKLHKLFCMRASATLKM